MKNDDVEVIVQATEIETGGKKRWKCHICGLTFSRQAAIANHHKLQVHIYDLFFKKVRFWDCA